MTIALVVLGWVAIGLVVAVVMIRRGHSPVIWLSLAAYGPIAAVLAWSARRSEAGVEPEVHAVGVAGPGTLDVLVGVDGSPESVGALTGVTRLLGPQLRRLCVAHVVDHDVHQLPGRALPNERAGELLEEATARVRAATGRAPTTVVLTGRPADALVAYADAEGYALVAAGRRGAGASTRLLGSAADGLTARADLPILLFGPDA